MKKILIPTDFSETSKNALKYGADLAVALGAQIDILHVFQIPVSVSDSYVYIPDQVCADSIGTIQYSGVGGQMDFMRGAALSEGGKPIIALSSRTAKGI